MTVTVTARGALAGRIPQEPDGVTLTHTQPTVGLLLDQLGVGRNACVVVVNGTAARPAQTLRDGDRVQLYPQQAGG